MSSLENDFQRAVPVERVAGLWPTSWIVVGPGFSREEIKGVILSEPGRGLTADAVTALPDLAAKIIHLTLGHAAGKDLLLGSSARQEALRMLMSERRIATHLSDLKRLRRQAGFFRKLDQALQAGRMAAAHAEEEEILTERLKARIGEAQLRPLREEIRLLGRVYDAWLEGAGLWDGPRLLREGALALAVHGWPVKLAKPAEILMFSAAMAEGLETAFCEELARHVAFKRIGPEKSTAANVSFAWERWHTLDDAADGLADELAQAGDFSDQVVLIPDQAAVRRTLTRAFRARGIPLADARDPNRLRFDEVLKWSLLPLEAVARDFERVKVVSYLRAWQAQPELSAWRAEIAARGIRQGLRAYAGGALAGVHSRLSELQGELGGRKSVEEISAAHLRLVRAGAGIHPERQWVIKFLESVWEQLRREQARLARRKALAPPLYWLERLNLAIAEAPAPMEPLKSEGGVEVFRFQQASLRAFKKIWMFGLSPSWLSLGEGGVGDYWFNEREREILGAEFAVRSGIAIRRERVNALSAWLKNAEAAVVIDAHYDWDGRERESLTPLLRELAQEIENASLARVVEDEKGEPVIVERGAHPRWLPSFGAIRPVPPRTVQLPALRLPPGRSGPEITATALDRYSRCAFQALAYHRWKLKDQREPEADLWPDMKGNVLHQAVKILLESRDAENRVQVSASEALERAWRARPPRGLLHGKRIEAYAKSRLVQVLEVFLKKEAEFRERAGTQTRVLDDDLQFRFDFGDFVVVGTPDRIEESADGLFVIDYKSSDLLPHGSEMLELGYRLQLPFYALAAEAALGKPVVGVQFVALTKKGSRTSGMFFSLFNGKEPGKLTNARSNSKSLLSLDPAEAWARMRETLQAQGKAYLAGRFDAAPKREDKECATCSLADLCGLRRLSSKEGSIEGGSE